MPGVSSKLSTTSKRSSNGNRSLRDGRGGFPNVRSHAGEERSGSVGCRACLARRAVTSLATPETSASRPEQQRDQRRRWLPLAQGKQAPPVRPFRALQESRRLGRDERVVGGAGVPTADPAAGANLVECRSSLQRNAGKRRLGEDAHCTTNADPRWDEHRRPVPRPSRDA